MSASFGLYLDNVYGGEHYIMLLFGNRFAITRFSSALRSPTSAVRLHIGYTYLRNYKSLETGWSIRATLHDVSGAKFAKSGGVRGKGARDGIWGTTPNGACTASGMLQIQLSMMTSSTSMPLTFNCESEKYRGTVFWLWPTSVVCVPCGICQVLSIE